MRRRWVIALVVVLVLAVGASIVVLIGIHGLRRAGQVTEENEARAVATAQAQARAYADAVREAARDSIPADAELRALGEPRHVIVIRVTRAPGLSLTLSSVARFNAAPFGNASAIVCFKLDVPQAGTANVEVELEQLPTCPAP
jgi:hypothetical protein